MNDLADFYIRRVSAAALREATRTMFDDGPHCLQLNMRDDSWVHQDSYDAGVVTVAKWLLNLADLIEAGEVVQ